MDLKIAMVVKGDDDYHRYIINVTRGDDLVGKGSTKAEAIEDLVGWIDLRIKNLQSIRKQVQDL